MNLKTIPGQRRGNPEYQKISVARSMAGLARSHRIIRTNQSIEIQILKLCSQIHHDDYKKVRSEKQRGTRRIKRLEK